MMPFLLSPFFFFTPRQPFATKGFLSMILLSMSRPATWVWLAFLALFSPLAPLSAFQAVISLAAPR